MCGLAVAAFAYQGLSAELVRKSESFKSVGLRLSLDDRCRVVELTDLAHGINYAHAKRESFLLGIQEHSNSKTRKVRVLVTCEPVKPKLNSELRVNMRLQEPFFKVKERQVAD